MPKSLRRYLPVIVTIFAVGGWLTLRATRAATGPSLSYQAENGIAANAQTCESAAGSAAYIRLHGSCTDTSTTKLYGAPWYAYSLNNFIVGIDDYRASFRFKATQSQPIDSVKYYVVFTDARPGYNAGNCGDLRISIQPDSGAPNHQPTGQELGSYTITEPCGPNEFGQKPTFPRHGFTPAVQLQKDNLYHIVFTNTDPAMASNWVSINGIYDYSATAPRQRGATDAEFAVLSSDNGGQSWKEHTKDTPILEVAYANGEVQGQSYMEFDYDANESTDLSHGQSIRQVITPSKGDVTTQKIHLRAGQSDWSNQEYPNSRGTVALKTSDGETLAQSELVPFEQPDRWTTIPLNSQVTLRSGKTYYLEVTAQTGNLMFIAMQKGTTYGFNPLLEFSDGFIEINRGNGWIPYTDEGKTQSCTCHDLSFYLE